MPNTLEDFIQTIINSDPAPILPISEVKRCHLLIPDSQKPIDGIFYDENYYSYVMAYDEEAAAQRGAERLTSKGDQILLTSDSNQQLVLWVMEPTAKKVDELLILPMQEVKRCHVQVPDMPKPIGAVSYNGCYYSYVMAYAEEDAAHRGAQRLIQKGNEVLLTTTPRRLILWVQEPDAQKA
ncbi:MAG: hypothetical protein VKJ64_18715 [Leptolyngbyaceae bacterium]|nr:hypothetical protein [Leptolyngbyaceae bacterium]